MKLSRLTRSHEWWDHKTPQILSLAYATALIGNVSLYDLLSPAFLMIFLSLVMIAIYASIINDFSDLEIDLACGKSNMMERMSIPLRYILTIGSFTPVLLASFFIYPNPEGLIFYLLIAVAISLYSFKPFRLKNRGIWGVISCAAAEHLLPTLFSISVIFYFSRSEVDWSWLVIAGIVSFCYGIRSILWHQFLDRDNDINAGIKTFASKIDPGSFKQPFIIVVELMALIFVLYRLDLWIMFLFLAFYTCFILLRQAVFKSRIITIIAPKNEHFQILMLDFYTIFFPLSLLIYAACTQHLGWLILLIHIILFYKILMVTFKDAYYLGRDLIKMLIR